MKNLSSAVGATSYPGRGILIGKSADATRAFLAYFIMGRSVNSRNRVFVEEPDGIRTEAFDPSKMEDPSLIIYHPVRVIDDKTIVTNGDQTDTIRDDILAGGDFHRACTTRTFEPDAPNFTPRISAMVERVDGDFRLEMSVLRCCDPETGAALRSFFEYDRVKPGCGYFIHTYAQDGNPIPSFTGEPESVVLESDFAAFSDAIWEALNVDNKVSLWTRSIDLATGATESRIYNKNA